MCLLKKLIIFVNNYIISATENFSKSVDFSALYRINVKNVAVIKFHNQPTTKTLPLFLFVM